MQTQAATISSPNTGRHVQVLREYEAFGATWRTDGAFVSTMRITNTLSAVPLSVTPVLYMADGFEYVLPSITIQPASVVEINLNAALDNAPPPVEEHRSDVGSGSVRYKWAWQAALSGTVLTADKIHSLTFSTALIFPAKPPSVKKEQRAEGLYWLPFTSTRAFMTLYNSSQEGIDAQIETLGSNGLPFRFSEIRVEPRGTKLVYLHVPTPGDEGQQHDACGGIRVSYNGTNRALVVNGGLEDYERGFSLSLKLVRPMNTDHAASSSYTVASSGLMNGRQSSAMVTCPPKLSHPELEFSGLI